MRDEMNHPDEGTIHAWLDGALAPDESARIAGHVAACPACAAAVAEARGLIAASSRILSALDDVPAGVIPGAGAATDRLADIRRRGRARSPWWRRGEYLAAASVLLVAGISTVTWRVTREGTPVDGAGALPAMETPGPAAVDFSPQANEADARLRASGVEPTAPPAARGSADVAGKPTAEAKRADRPAPPAERPSPERETVARDVATARGGDSAESRRLAERERAVGFATGIESRAAERKAADPVAPLPGAQRQQAVAPLPGAQRQQAVAPQALAAPPQAGAARAEEMAVRLGVTGTASSFPSGCYELRAPGPGGGLLLGVPGRVRLIAPPGSASPRDTTWRTAESLDDSAIRVVLVWRMADSLTVELRVLRPVDSTMVRFRPLQPAPPPAPAPGGVVVAEARRIACP